VWNESLPCTAVAGRQCFYGTNNTGLVKFICVISYYRMAVEKVAIELEIFDWK